MRRFMKNLCRRGLAAYGEGEVRHNLELGAVEVLLLSEDLRKVRARIECTNRSCDFSESQTRSASSPPPGNCPKCGSALTVAAEEDIVSDLSRLADQSGAERLKSSPPSSKKERSSTKPSEALQPSSDTRRATYRGDENDRGLHLLTSPAHREGG